MTGHKPWSEIRHKTDTKALVERVRAGLESFRDGETREVLPSMRPALAALSELEERLVATERLLTEADGHGVRLLREKQTAEHERDDLRRRGRVWAERIVSAERRVAELEEALRKIVDDAHIRNIWHIARAALDRAKETE